MGLRHLLTQLKLTTLVPPQLKNNGAVSGNTYLDTQGLGAALFAMVIGTTDVIVGSTDTSTAPYLEECDTAGGSYTAVTGAALAAVIASTGDDKIRAIFVDLTKSHKRYMRWNAPTAGNSTGANLCSVALGFPANHGPMTAAAMGLAELIQA
jgi:hypothetical protein